MDLFQKISLENRVLRHGLFWLAWIVGFTFVKSFGASLDTYLGWLVYYVVTLPIFIVHTYLIVYWAAKKFLKGPGIILFILLFIVIMSVFSFIELIVTDEFLSSFFPEIFSSAQSYLDIGNVLISGIGNLYIILVFAAAKMIRQWYVADHHKQIIVERNLYLQRADVNAGIQPGMLLFAIEKIEKLVSKKSENVPGAIALLSELLNAVMQAQRNKVLRVDEEAKNVKRMLGLYALLLDKNIPNIRIEGEELSLKYLPVFIVFSPIEIICRNYGALAVSDIQISLANSRPVEINWKSEVLSKDKGVARLVREEMEKLYPKRFHMEIQTRENYLSLSIEEQSSELLSSGK